MIPVYPQTKIFIMCPPSHATGGTELLHQLAFKLRKLGYSSFLFYMPEGSENPVHKNFEHYQTEHVTIIEDNKLNVLIMPEIYIEQFRSTRFKHIRKVIWWLSVDDYVRRIKEMVGRKSKKPFFWLKRIVDWYRFPDTKFFRRNPSILHLVQSKYAQNFLTKHQVRVAGFLSDFLNKEFLKRESQDTPKTDYVLFNPLKGLEFTKKLIAVAPYIQWRALEKLSPAEIADLLNRSKVYIDFGHHPGKDRFPREAAISGCCVITGKRGSSNFSEDVPILEEFKFDESIINPQLIIEKIKRCLNDYDNESQKFDVYRQIIKSEEQKFEGDILKVFVKVQGVSF